MVQIGSTLFGALGNFWNTGIGMRPTHGSAKNREILLATSARRRHGVQTRTARDCAVALWKNGLIIYPAMLVIKNKVLEP